MKIIRGCYGEKLKYNKKLEVTTGTVPFVTFSLTDSYDPTM